MAELISFESSREKNIQRQQLREARETVLKHAKAKYEKEEWKKEQAKLRGEDTWMLPAVSGRIEREEEEIRKIKSKKVKKEKKKKKHKKERKQSSKHAPSVSDSESNENIIWVEKGVNTDEPVIKGIVKGPQLPQRDSWMLDVGDFGALPSTSKSEINEQRKRERETEKEKNASLNINEPGKHELELNPYWRDGGTGLPEEQGEAEGEGQREGEGKGRRDRRQKATPTVLSAGLTGDGGVGWWKRALQRCEEAAQEEGRPLEEIAAERYGSLKKLRKMLSEAEQIQRGMSHRPIVPRQDAKDTTPRQRGPSLGQGVDGARDSGGGRDRSNEENRYRNRDVYDRTRPGDERRVRDYDDGGADKRRRGFERSRRGRDSETFARPERERERFARPGRDAASGVKGRFVKPGDSDEDVGVTSSSRRETPPSAGESRRTFMKPSGDTERCVDDRGGGGRRFLQPRGGDEGYDGSRRRGEPSRSTSGRGLPAWKKKVEHDADSARERTAHEKGDPSRSKSSERERSPERRRSDGAARRRRRSSVSSSDSSDGRGPRGRRDSRRGRGRSRASSSDSSDGRGSRGRRNSRRGTARSSAQTPQSRTPDSGRQGKRRNERCSSEDSAKEGSSEQRSKRVPRSSASSDSSSDSSDSSSGVEDDVTVEAEPPKTLKVLSEQEMNQLGAKLIRAEMMGNQALAEQLKAEMEAARATRESVPEPAQPAGRPSGAGRQGEEQEADDGVVVLSRSNRAGMARPLPASDHPSDSNQGRRRKKQKVNTHTKGGDRERYFADDDRHDLKSLVEREKLGTAEDSNMMFARLAGRGIERTDDDHQLDDVFVQRAINVQSESKMADRERSLAINEHRKMQSAVEKCGHCFDNVAKHLIICIGSKCYVSLPNHRSLTEGHCLIVPMKHVSQATILDEDVWEEMQMFRRCLTRMFESREEDCVFMETSMNLRRFPHMVLECVPMERSIGDMAPIYFKKAIQEVGPEWAQNKKLVDLSKKDVRRAIPKGFPYFSVDFGLQGGFGHVIEDEQTFPPYFGREIVGGMLDLEPQLWRKPHRENFEDQRKKVLQFAEWWKPYDWTQSLGGGHSP